jgi:hypothetical protein
MQSGSWHEERTEAAQPPCHAGAALPALSKRADVRCRADETYDQTRRGPPCACGPLLDVSCHAHSVHMVLSWSLTARLGHGRTDVLLAAAVAQVHEQLVALQRCRHRRRLRRAARGALHRAGTLL